MDKSNIALDLDALAPKSVQINYKGSLITVNPPTLEQYITVGEIANKMKTANQSDMQPVNEAKQIVREVIPDLADVELNLMQLIGLFNLIVELGNPSSDEAVAELKKRGIELKTKDTPSPKDSAS